MDELEQAALEGAAPEVVSEETASEATENTEGQEEDPPGQTEEKSRSQQRRERREAAVRHAEQEKEAAIARADELERRLSRIRSSRESEAPPKEEDFQDVIEFAAARALWKQRQADAQYDVAEISSEAVDHRQKAEAMAAKILAERANEFSDQIAEKRTQYVDLDQVLAVAQRSDVVSNQVAEMILASDVAVDLAYHLGKNPAIARQISQMPPIAAARELGRIEARLSLPRAKLETDAPPPIAPVKPKGTASTRDVESMSYEEYKAARKSGRLK